MEPISLLMVVLLVPASKPELRLPKLLPTYEPVPISMSPERLAAALNWAREKVAGYRELEKARVLPSGLLPTHHRRYAAADPAEQQLGREALAWVEAARAPANLTAWQTTERPSCPAPEQPNCETSPRYRRIDGACNNPDNPLWGAANTPLMRLRADTFEDGVNVPRSLGRYDTPLASARRISATVSGSKDEVIEALTLSVANWGQLMDHDITLSPQFLSTYGAELECCRDGQIITSGAHPQCLPIEIPSDDSFYGPLGQRCMNFVRSMPAMPPSCQPGPTITKNVLTAFIDGSSVYGSSTERADMVRLKRHGLLKSQGRRGYELLPAEPAGSENGENPCFSPNETTHPCFLAGDGRVNEQSGLTVMHTIWMREHNRVAKTLYLYNRGWDDERIFQEARKIVGAEIQHITYQEWLPIILGRRYMWQMNIHNWHYGFSPRYSPEVNPTIATEFSTAAFRFGHTLIQGNLRLYSRLTHPPPGVSLAVDLRDLFFDPTLIYQGRLDQFAIGMVTQPPQQFDSCLAEDLTNFLFQEDGVDFGMDLMALNIQRGRDHGIPSYNTMREHCGLGRAARFSDLRRHISSSVWRKLQRVYRHVDDIDLFVGAVAERPASEAVIGPTMQCIVGDQFARLRWGDNHFYDLGGSRRPWRFTSNQLSEVRHASWARVLCDNIRGISTIQRNAFKAASSSNPIEYCNKLPSVNLLNWREH